MPTTESFTTTGIMAICLRTVLSNLTDEAKCEIRVLEMGHSSHPGRSAMASSVCSLYAFRDGLASSFNETTDDWGAAGGFLTACAVLDEAAI